MNSAQWYYAQGDKQIGPVTSAQIRQLVGAGVLGREDLVWREGMEEWIPAQGIKGLFKTASQTADTFANGPSAAAEPKIPEMASLPPVMDTATGTAVEPSESDRPARAPRGHLVDRLLRFVRGQLNAPFVESAARLFTLCGHYGLYVAMFVYFTFAIVVGIMKPDLHSIQLACGAVLILAVLQYVAGRLWETLDRVRQTSAASIASTALPDCLAALCMAAGVITLLSRAFSAIPDAYHLILSGLPAFILFQYLAVLALNPGSLNVTIAAEIGARDEAIGILVLMLKAGLRLVPVAFCVGIVVGIIRLLHASYEAISAYASIELAEELSVSLEMAKGDAFTALESIAIAAAAPLLGYIFFLLCYLCIEVVHAILSILSVSGKVDRLAEKDEP